MRPRFHLTRYAGVLASNAALRAEVVPGHARENARSDVTNDTAQRELFAEEVAQNLCEKTDKMRASRHPWASLLKRVFAVEVLVCVHCAGNLRLVEIAGGGTGAIKRIIRDERRRRGQPLGEMEARGSPRGQPGSADVRVSVMATGDRLTLRDFAKAKLARRGGEAGGLSAGNPRSSRETARGNDAESGPSFNHAPRWAEIDRMPVQLKKSLEDARRGFVV